MAATSAENDPAIRVFFADDHMMVREGLAALVSKDSGFRVVGQCGDGLKVTSEVTRTRPDVVVLDIMMPGLNGLEICRELRKKMRHTAVLILTMYDDEQFIGKALEYGAAGYLLKESAGDQLAVALRSVARGQVFLGPGIHREALSRVGGKADDPYERLTSRERQVLQLIAEGKTNRQIADQLQLATKTVDTHRSHLMRKLNIHDQTTLVKFAIRKGLISVG